MSKRNLYLLTYPDGSRKHIDRDERDNMIVAGNARQTAPNRYFYIGVTHTFHAMFELSKLMLSTSPLDTGPLYYRGTFIFERAGKRTAENMESPRAMALRLAKP